MTIPTFDIIIPVWNSPTETRDCLTSVLESTTTERLIIINNRCDRITELMLEEFSDHLGDRAIYMTMERNIGFVPAVNRALARSDADWVLIVRPTGTLSRLCLQKIKEAAAKEQTGIITPLCHSEIPPNSPFINQNCTSIETCQISFTQLALSNAMRNRIGFFDEELDGGTWCLQDYRHRADAAGFLTCLLPTVIIKSQAATVFGSTERRLKIDSHAFTAFSERWGNQRSFAVYLPKETEEAYLCTLLETLLAAARHGHHFELLLHHRQYKLALKHGALCLHSGLIIHKLSRFTPLRSLASVMLKLTAQNSQLLPVCGLDGIPFPGYGNAVSATILTKLATS